MELSYTSGKVYLEPWDNGTLLIFQERNIQNPGIMELSYVPRNGPFQPDISLLFSGSNFASSKNKRSTLKMILKFREMELSSPTLV